MLEPIIKTAIRREDIKGNYIICEYAPVTDFEWFVTESAVGLRSWAHCNIIGPNPWDYPLLYEFKTSGNLFVFYVEEQKEYYSEEALQDMLEYTVSGWDIIYPVSRSNYFTTGSFLKSPKYILESDLRRR